MQENISFDGFNVDIYNAFMFFMKGLDVSHMQPLEWMDNSLYDAVAFAQANPLEGFVGCAEYSLAVADYAAEILGQALLQMNLM